MYLDYLLATVSTRMAPLAALVQGQVIVVQSALRLFELVDSSIWLGDHEYVLVACC